MMESVHHNIQTAESMYTPINAELLQKHYGGINQGQFSQLPPGQYPPHLTTQFQSQLPPGVISARGIPPNTFPSQDNQRVMSPPTQQFLPPNMIPASQPNGNFVYTRRIIDPKNGGVVAEETIG